MSAAEPNLVERAIARRGIVATDQEVARLRAVFRADHRLEREEALDAWLKARKLTRIDLDAQLSAIIRFGKLKAEVVGEGVPRNQHHHVFAAWIERGGDQWSQ